MDRRHSQSKGDKARTQQQSAKRQVRSAPNSPVTPPRTDATLSPEERHQMIAEAAYYRAKRRGFCGGDPLQDWVEAEAELGSRLGEVSQQRRTSRMGRRIP